MRLYFGGGEIGGHRSVLHEQGVTNMAMSYMGLRRRVNFSKPWLIKEKFPSGVSVFLDSGAYTINHDDDFNTDELVEISEHYQDFVTKNLDAVDIVSEFDAMPLGLEWIEEQREAFYNDLPREKFMVVWHPVWGLPYLQELASRYEIVGIPATSMQGRDLRPVLNGLAAQGTRIHGIAMTKTEEMLSIRWDSVASTSWISPQRYGDTIVWTGNELKRYPKKYKDSARRRHRTLFQSHGFDAEAIANDDPSEVLRLSVWSWKKFEEYVNRRHRKGGVVTPLFSSGDVPDSETAPEVVDTQPEEADKNVPTRAVAKRRDSDKILPVMGLHQEQDEDEKDLPPLVQIRSESPRMCNTCFLRDKCPGFEEDSNCIYNIPITLRTREQIRAMHQGLLEMQSQRVMFMRMSEEMEGGYADPNLTKEMTLLNKMMADYAAMDAEGFSMTISARGNPAQAAQSGMFSRIFGNDVGQKVQQIESGPVAADDVIEAEFYEDGDDK